MSTHDPIDLDAIKQAVFRENLPDFLNHVYFWMITDQYNQILSCSSPENVNSILNSKKLSQNDNDFSFSSIELVTHEQYPIAMVLEVISFKMTINEMLVCLKVFNTIKNTNVKFELFNSKIFNRIDKNYNELSFFDSINRLQKLNPLEVLTAKEWTVAWLIIHGLTNKEIAKIKNKSVNTINKTVSRLLGIYKLDLFDRHLLSDVGFYLNWDCYVPLSLIESTV